VPEVKSAAKKQPQRDTKKQKTKDREGIKMRRKVDLAVKKPGNKEKDSLFNKPKPDFSQFENINSPVEQVLQLQRIIGNRAVTRLIQSGDIQAKLKIGQPGDIFEQEADRAAEQVMQMPGGSLVRKESKTGCPGCLEEEFIQTKPASGSTFEVNPGIESRIQSLKGSGQPLSQSTRDFFEPRFNVDFSGVRTHQDTDANHLASSLGARAFTLGKDVWMGKGESTSDKRLMAHELTHVVQQNKDSRMIQAQGGAAATLAGLTARRTAFSNTGTTNADNCCATCPSNLGVGVAGGAQNGMELEYTISGTIPGGTEFDITRTVTKSNWQQVGGTWSRIEHLPAGTKDDYHDDDECLIPNRRRIFVVDSPGMPSMNPRGVRLLGGATVSNSATAFVGKMSFWEWVIARNRRLGIGWTVISRPTFTRWHTITSLALVGGTWQRVNTPGGDSNEIALGRISVTGATP
jgi:hypothetical protein